MKGVGRRGPGMQATRRSDAPGSSGTAMLYRGACFIQRGRREKLSRFGPATSQTVLLRGAPAAIRMGM